MIQGHQKLIVRINFLYDGLAVVTAFVLSWWLRFKSGWLAGNQSVTLVDYLPLLVFIVPLALLLNYFNGVYSFERRRSFSEQLIVHLRTNLFWVLGIMAILFFFKEVHISRLFLAIFIVLNLIICLCERVLIKFYLDRIYSQEIHQRRMLILGAGSLGIDVTRRILNHKEIGYHVIGYLDDDTTKIEVQIEKTPIKVLGTTDKLETVARNYAADEVIITLPLYAHDKLNRIIDTCESLGLKTMIVPDYFDFIPARPRIEDLEGIPLLNIRHVPLDEPLNGIYKRTFDIVFAIVVLITLSPLFGLIAVSVRLSSPGPVLYKQERLGINKKPFMMYKFRSMREAKNDEDRLTWSSQNDPRLTKLGTFLRRTSLDELPQFWNVLIGEMSVIGPRPERPFFVNYFKEAIPKYMIKHHVRPGITGWAQVHGLRGDTSIEERIKYDLYYVENWSFDLDLKIMFMTILNGFINPNAY